MECIARVSQAFERDEIKNPRSSNTGRNADLQTDNGK